MSINYLGYEHEVYLSEQKKKTDEYIHGTAEAKINSALGVRGHIITARNYYSSTRDAMDFEYLEDIYGMQNPIDLGFTNIIKPRVDALVGMSLMSEPDFMVHYTDKETIDAAKKEKADALIKELSANLQKNLGQQSNDTAEGKEEKKEAGVAEKTKLFFEEIAEKYSSEYQASFQIAASHIVRLIETDAEIDLSNVKKEISKDYFITGECFTRELYCGEGKDPKIEVVLPEEIFTNRPAHDKDHKRTSVVVHKRRVSPHHILKELGDKLSKEDAIQLFSSYGSMSSIDIYGNTPDANTIMTSDNLGAMDSLYLKTGWSNSDSLLNLSNSSISGLTEDLVDFYHVEWLASTRIQKPDGGGYVYREDRYECYRIGADIYVAGRRCDEAPRTKDQPWKTCLSYRAAINVSRNGVIHSMVNSMREVQDLYDIIMFFRNNMVANSGVSGSRVNVAGIPKALGKKFMDRLTKWITIRKQGLELVDPTEEGANLFQYYGDFDASVNGNSINAINAILESLTVQADIVSGVPRQMLGVIEERDAVENVRAGMNQVSVLSLEMFREVDRCLNRAVQGTLDNFKYAYRNKAIEGVYKNGAAMIAFTADPMSYGTTDHKVTVVSSGIENDKLVRIQTLAKEFAKQSAVSPEALIKVINCKSVNEIEFILTKAIAKAKKEQMNMQQMQQKVDDLEKESKQDKAEIDRLNNNIQAAQNEKLKLQRAKDSNEHASRIREIDLMEKKERNTNTLGEKELVIKEKLVALEHDQMLYDNGRAQEVQNNV